MKKLHHPYVVHLYEVINDPKKDKLYLVMQLLNGPNLMKKLESYESGMLMEDVRKIAKNMVSALQYCHDEVKVVHRDIKPENIMMNDDDAVLVDFGVGALFQGEDDILKGTAGSMRYFSPEIVKTGGEKKVFGCKTDVWALGVTLF